MELTSRRRFLRLAGLQSGRPRRCIKPHLIDPECDSGSSPDVGMPAARRSRTDCGEVSNSEQAQAQDEPVLRAELDLDSLGRQ